MSHTALPRLRCFYGRSFAFCSVSFSSSISPQHRFESSHSGVSNSPISCSRVSFEWLPQFRETSLTKTSSSMPVTCGSRSRRQWPLPSRSCLGGHSSRRQLQTEHIRHAIQSHQMRADSPLPWPKVPKICQSRCHTPCHTPNRSKHKVQIHVWSRLYQQQVPASSLQAAVSAAGMQEGGGDAGGAVVQYLAGRLQSLRQPGPDGNNRVPL